MIGIIIISNIFILFFVIFLFEPDNTEIKIIDERYKQEIEKLKKGEITKFTNQVYKDYKRRIKNEKS